MIETTPNHPFLTQARGWVVAGELVVGDKIRQAEGQFGTVEAIQFVAKPQAMYNLTVDEAHTYFVGQGQWLVHNDCFSLVHNDPRLVKEAEKLGKSPELQRQADNLIKQLHNGNTNPGIGTKPVFGNVHEARSIDGVRIYFRNTPNGNIEILGKSTKANQQKVIDILQELYGR